MKEQEERSDLDNIFIEGLIREAEQDNADFEAAMRSISDEDFFGIINEHSEIELNMFGDSGPVIHRSVVVNHANAPIASSFSEEAADFSRVPAPEYQEQIRESGSRKFKLPRHWLIALASAVAIILIVLIPSVHVMNSKLCESAVYASRTFSVVSDDGIDYSTAPIEQVKEKLPALEEEFKTLNTSHRGLTSKPEVAWNLAIAYLRLHRKGDAVKILETLETNMPGTQMGNNAAELLRLLD